MESRMNMDEINEAFDREYDKYKNSPDYKAFVKIKMPQYYIAKHSDEDLRAAVLAEREACAKLCEELSEKWYDEGGSASDCAAAIRARGEK
jgi:hypothetical protein